MSQEFKNSMTGKPTGKNIRRQQAIIRLTMMALILVCLNVLASWFHKGLDLTHEKRFTLTPSTKKLLHNMQETAVIEVYLKGKKFPAELQRLQESVREHLASFKEIAGAHIIYKFTDPFEGKSEEEQKQVSHDLHEKGIATYPLSNYDDNEYSTRPFCPFALVQYNGKEMAINLLTARTGTSRAEQVAYSEASLEYKFISAINTLNRRKKPRVGYMIGHNEDVGVHAIAGLSALSQLYDLDSLNLKHMGHISNAYDAIIINQPNIPFTDPEKLKIDQYVMRGGHILWAVKTMQASMDSFANGNMAFLATDFGLNLDDLLYKYGVRVNSDIIEDKQCMQIPQVEGKEVVLHNWRYFPKINPTSQHPIVRNMGFIRGGFSSSIDTILTAALKKTILLESSKYSRVAGSPVRISLTSTMYPVRDEMFHDPYRPVAVLMEGKFHSAFEHRLAPSYLQHLDSINETFRPHCDTPTSMIVTSIGDVFENDYTAKDGPLPLYVYHYDPNGNYANEDFLLNCMEYLTDQSGILEARSKDVKLRLLDEGRAKDEKTTWQWLNVGLPIVLVLVFASAYTFFRKRRYETATAPSAKNP